MNNNLIIMLEDTKTGTYKGIHYYLSSDDLQALKRWYENYSNSKYIDDEELVSLVYELYIREDIDLRPYEDYNALVLALANKYQFDSAGFLDMYQQFKRMLFGGFGES